MDYKIFKYIFLLIIFFNSVFMLSATELTFKITPTGALPFLTTKVDRYNKVGGGAYFSSGVNFLEIFNAGPDLGLLFLPKNNYGNLKEGEDAAVTFIFYGLHGGVLVYPGSRIEVEAGIGGGAYMGITNQYYHYAPYYKAFGDVAFRFTPDWTVGANVSWFDYQYDTYWGNPGAAGVSVGVSVRYKIDTKKSTGKVDSRVMQDENVFPLMYKLYTENPFGTIIIENNETAEIRDVKISFRAGDYTASELECGSVKILKKHKTLEIPIMANFSEKILQFSEEGKIPGELVVRYKILGQPRTAISPVVIPVYNRNQVRWSDPAILSCYISTKGQEILELSKYLVGVARGHLRSGLNRNMQFAMYLYEGIRLAGINYKADAETPYNSYHLDAEQVDYIQYPFQTLLYKTGDKDDLGVLFMSLLESVGIDTAFIPLEKDFIVAFNLKTAASKVNTLFDGSDRVLFIDDEIWIPVSMTMLREGFVNAWYKAIIEVQSLMNAGEELPFVSLSEAWQSYPQVGYSSGEDINARAPESTVVAAAEIDLARYITAEFGPQIAAVQNQIKQEGASTKLYNKLGMLYVRAGMYSSAIPIFEQSAKMGSVSAMTNLGNIASTQKRYLDAKKWFEKALELEPGNKSAKKNLNRVMGEIEPE
ncbi:tetratricopeptide repeat protein [Treponema zioleckii]|uniref:tetratricopeptide repeat protein n=1 Tax=Treponema zioleckii TaxID=331680 RepID=UPI00168A9716|nr:tetratricopeptide repeat protein [Treponema zioleckii]